MWPYLFHGKITSKIFSITIIYFAIILIYNPQYKPLNAESSIVNYLTHNQSQFTKEQYLDTQIPNKISLIAESSGMGELLLTAINNNGTIQYTRDINDELTPFQLTKWHQVMEFELNDTGNNQDNLTITNLLIGNLKDFDSFDDLLKESKSYKNVPLKSNVFVLLPNESVSFMAGEIEFPSGISGLYYGLFDANLFADTSKSKPDQSTGNSKVIEMANASPFEIRNDSSLFNVTHDVICNDLVKLGYKKCI
ncbi:MAG: hypothetical protein M3162_06750 [Thermoproteota archaeon]|nr:hypothetical protein [Thermoproteota archaeon]